MEIKDNLNHKEKIIPEILKEKEKENENDIIQTIPKQMIFERRNRKLVFAALLLICICVNFDNGIVPSASKEIKELLDIDNQIFGLYGSLSFFGCLIGKLFIFICLF